MCAREPYRASIIFGPQLTDLCIEGIVCWGQFYKSFRPFDQRILIFRPADGEELHLTHDEYLHLVLSVYKKYHKALTSGTTNSRMLECLRQVVQREIRDRECRANPTPHQSVNKSDPQYAERL